MRRAGIVALRGVASRRMAVVFLASFSICDACAELLITTERARERVAALELLTQATDQHNSILRRSEARSQSTQWFHSKTESNKTLPRNIVNVTVDSARSGFHRKFFVRFSI